MFSFRCQTCKSLTEPRFAKNGHWVCFRCHKDASMRTVETKYRKTTIRIGDRFMWDCHKWYVLEFQGDEVVARLEGTPDVALLPESLVAELVGQWQEWQTYYLR